MHYEEDVLSDELDEEVGNYGAVSDDDSDDEEDDDLESSDSRY